MFNVWIGGYIFKEYLWCGVYYRVINYVVVVCDLVYISGILINIVFFVVKGIFKGYCRI